MISDELHREIEQQIGEAPDVRSSYDDEIICPACNDTLDSSEINDEIDLQCDCGVTLEVHPQYSVTFETTIKEDAEAYRAYMKRYVEALRARKPEQEE